jgi:hypothetical protein
MPPKDITETIYSAPLPRRPETGLLAWQATIGYINVQYNLDARLELMVQPKEADLNWSAAAEWGQNHEEAADEPTIGAALRELWSEISRKHIIFASREAVARKPAGYADDEWLDKETSLLLSRLLDAARLVYKTEWRLKLSYQSIELPNARFHADLHSPTNVLSGRSGTLREACREIYRHLGEEFQRRSGQSLDS